MIEGASVFSAFTREWLEGDVAIADGRFAGVGATRAASASTGAGTGSRAGFIDAHMHVESSKLTVGELARVLVARGTTTIVCDPHELANALGPGGRALVHRLLRGPAAGRARVAPACVPASPFESPRAPLSLDRPGGDPARERVLGLAEMMNFPAVIAGAPDELAKLALAAGKRVDGHAPGRPRGRARRLPRHRHRTDHEATTLRRRSRSAARAPGCCCARPRTRATCATCCRSCATTGPSAARSAPTTASPTCCCARATSTRCAASRSPRASRPRTRCCSPTLHPALCHGLPHVGAIAPGYRADCVLLDDLGSFRASLVLKDGRVVAEDGVAAPFDPAPAPDWVRDSVRIAPLPRRRLPRSRTQRRPRARDRARARSDLTEHLVLAPSVSDGEVVADPERDLAKIAVVERHHATGRIGLGLVRGFGLRRGAIATTVAHDAHNIVAVGMADDDLALLHRAARRDRRRHRDLRGRRRCARSSRCRSRG